MNAVFDWTCAELEKATGLSALQSRGTVRLALNEAGLSPTSVMRKPMMVVLSRILPGELRARGVREAEAICEDIRRRLEAASLEGPERSETPEDVFARLGRRTRGFGDDV